MKRLVKNANKHRLAANGISLLLANFLVALLIDQFRLNIAPSLIVNGTLLLAAVVNKLVSWRFTGGERDGFR